MFAPGGTIDGVAGWELDAPPRWVEVRLYWKTSGKGSEDMHVAATARFDDPPAVDARVFQLSVPRGPYSYRGTLLEIGWGIELVAHKVKDAARVEVEVSPGGKAGR